MNAPSLRQPAVYLPLAMSLVAFTLVLVHFLVLGLDQKADEGTAAHVFQLLIVAQLPFMLFLAVRWLRLAPRQTLRILALQFSGVIAAICAVVFLT
jgi:hypothetical protein